MLLSLRVSPYLPLRRFVFFLCRSSSSSPPAPPPPPMAGYKEAFARRMAMAGIKPHHRIALGVSGGPDSMALCVLAGGWKLDGSARKDEASGYIEGLLGIVVDHRLRPESTEEAEIVRDRVNRMDDAFVQEFGARSLAVVGPMDGQSKAICKKLLVR